VSNEGLSASQLASHRQKKLFKDSNNTHTLTRQLIGKSVALEQLKGHSVGGRDGAKAVASQIKGAQGTLYCYTNIYKSYIHLFI